MKACLGSGTMQWLLQRLSAVVMLAYFAPILWLWLSGAPADYAIWHGCLSSFWMHVLAALSLIALVVHAWLGLWTVATDYIGCPCLRRMVLALVALYLLGLLFFGMVFIGF